MTAGDQLAGSARTSRLAVATAALVALALVAIAWWVTSPRTVPDYSSSAIGMDVPAARTVLIDAGVYTADGAVISLASAVPRVAENSADADVDVVLCRRDGTGTDIVGTAFGDDTPCDEIPIPGASEALPNTAQLIVKITPRLTGDVRVEGIDLTYRDDLQRGTVHVGMLIETSTD